MLNWQNKAWMQFFNQERDIWRPIASEWERLLKEFKTQNYDNTQTNITGISRQLK